MILKEKEITLEEVDDDATTVSDSVFWKEEDSRALNPPDELPFPTANPES